MSISDTDETWSTGTGSEVDNENDSSSALDGNDSSADDDLTTESIHIDSASDEDLQQALRESADLYYGSGTAGDRAQPQPTTPNDIIAVSSDSDGSEPDNVSTSNSTVSGPSRKRSADGQPKAESQSSQSPVSSSAPTAAAATGGDDDSCPICLDLYTLSGDHQICSLKCGHLFGKNCIDQWLKQQRKERTPLVCPTCKAPAKVTDVRRLYATRLRPVDNSEAEAAQKKAEEEHKRRIAAELALNEKKYELERCLRQVEVLKQQAQLSTGSAGLSQPPRPTSPSAALSSRGFDGRNTTTQPPPARGKFTFKFVQSCTLGTDCRVMGTCPTRTPASYFVATQKVPESALYSGMGIRKISLAEGVRAKEVIPLHKTVIRDLAVAPNQLLLSCAMDRTLRITSLVTSKYVQNKQLDAVPWSCCWHSSNEFQFFLGLSSGEVVCYDTRKLDNPLEVVFSPRAPSDPYAKPVISLSHVSRTSTSSADSTPSDALLVGQMNRSFLKHLSGQQAGEMLPLPLNDSPLMSLRYSNNWHVAMINYRTGPLQHSLIGVGSTFESTKSLLEVSADGGCRDARMIRPTFYAVHSDGYLLTERSDLSSAGFHLVTSNPSRQSIDVLDHEGKLFQRLDAFDLMGVSSQNRGKAPLMDAAIVSGSDGNSVLVVLQEQAVRVYQPLSVR